MFDRLRSRLSWELETLEEWLLHDDTMRTDHGAAIQLELDLRQAVDAEDLGVAYQFVVDVADGRPVGTEALLRWDHAPGGGVSPVAFVPVLIKLEDGKAVGSVNLDTVADLPMLLAEE